MRSRDQPVSMTVSKANTADKIVSVQFFFHFHMEGSASLLRARNFLRRPGQQSIRWRKRMRCKKMSRISSNPCRMSADYPAPARITRKTLRIPKRLQMPYRGLSNPKTGYFFCPPVGGHTHFLRSSQTDPAQHNSGGNLTTENAVYRRRGTL